MVSVSIRIFEYFLTELRRITSKQQSTRPGPFDLDLVSYFWLFFYSPVCNWLYSDSEVTESDDASAADESAGTGGSSWAGTPDGKGASCGASKGADGAA